LKIGFPVIDPFISFQRSVFMSGRGYFYFAQTPGLPLSLKSMFNGRAFKIHHPEYSVDDNGYPHRTTASPIRSRPLPPRKWRLSFCGFPWGWAEEVLRSSTLKPEQGCLDNAGKLICASIEQRAKAPSNPAAPN
jgi:hypothetical protein